ncbi:hypothetical protein SAMN05216262_108140 [Colwellia chukchiensis]|uniref:Uncharacterized protein n=1 Tax=Colwellia chukchiensis TaxID=641665 RepID=A0A1H7P0F4_9GAMM|nr:hypothetical protein [Colwellia chukchiensis]SEL28954.1 hypothetical protein SAMN05216262_108140 [Colwellia chukchiensis]
MSQDASLLVRFFKTIKWNYLIMKKRITLGISLLTSMVAVGGTLEYDEKLGACSSIDGHTIYNETGRTNILGKMVNFNLIKDDDVSFMLLGTTNRIANKKQYHCDIVFYMAKIVSRELGATRFGK